MRKSTPPHVVLTIDTQAVVFGPASKTDCIKCAKSMNVKGRKQSVMVQRDAR